jgi:hypothetical protein
MDYIYFDHTDFSISLDSRPNVYMMASVKISSEEFQKVEKTINLLKLIYGDIKMPLKYSINSLRSHYIKYNSVAEFENLKNNYAFIINNIFKSIENSEFEIVTAAYQIYDFGYEKDDAIRFTFSNCLQRWNYDANKTEKSVIIDWPDSNNNNPYREEYHSAYYYGVNTSGIPFYGDGYQRQKKLSVSGFLNAPQFKITLDDTGLQFIDIIAGAIRQSFVQYLKKNFNHFSHGYVKSILPKFRNKNGKLTSIGIVTNQKQNPLLRRLFTEYINFQKNETIPFQHTYPIKLIL